MAEAFLQILLENLTSLIQGEIGLIMGVDNEMKKLSRTLATIRAVLEDAEDKQLQNKAIRSWLRKLNELSYEIDDVLDECSTEVAQLEYQNRKSKVFSIKRILYKRKIGRRLKELIEKLDVVAAQRTQFHLHETSVVWQSKLPAKRETGSVRNNSHRIYGRDEEKEKIVNILLNQLRDHDEPTVLPIVGVGGLGKTTFAQLVFNDNRVTEHFNVKLWVCVSDDFDLKTLIRAMIASATLSESTSNFAQLDPLQQSLFQLLNQKRYLLILDDVWNEDQEKWSMLKDLLACGSSGSSIIVTTRLKKVADIMSTIPSHYLEGLSEETCWLLFKQCAFTTETEEHTKLEAIGRQIVRKCAGVPLAAKALGELLQFTRKEDYWIHVKESEIWSLPQEESSILPALRLSYQHLPFKLRQCFAYCAFFPKDTWIDKKELILHWIAHGYISSNGKSRVENNCDEIFNELILRSLFQNVETRSDGCVVFQLHDLVHDLAQAIMGDRVPGAQAEVDNTRVSKDKIRQVHLQRKLVAFPPSIHIDLDLASVLTKFSRLRILDASDTCIKEVPAAIGNLKHIRYLNLSRTKIRTLPDTLCSLWNLKILNLDGCSNLECLPKSMKRLCNLIYLFLDKCLSLSQMPPKIGGLVYLKALSMFVVSRGKYNQLKELKYLDLEGDLCIRHLERVDSLVDVKRANSCQKQNLHELSFIWNKNDSCKSHSIMDEEVLEALEPHANVKNLKIEGFENLSRIIIWDCPNCSSLPQVLGDLPHLKELYLRNIGANYIVKDAGQDFNLTRPKFPVLEGLFLRNLHCLRGLFEKEGGVAFPVLERLTAQNCPSFTLPQLSSLKVVSCNNKVLPSFGKLDNLTTLWIEYDENKALDPIEALENLINLQSLTILGANEHSMPDEGFQGLKSLTKLDIRGSNTITCLPARWLSHLTF